MNLIELVANAINEKVSKKQIIAIVGILAVLAIVVPEKNELILCAAKIVSISVISLVALGFQWNLDKSKEKKDEENTDIANASDNTG